MMFPRCGKTCILLAVGICLAGCIVMFFSLNSSKANSVYNPAENMINSAMEIKVQYLIEAMDGAPGHMPLSEKSYVPLGNSRVILIDDRTGEIVNTGLTNSGGNWKANITVSRDPRFTDNAIGTVTVIAVAEGYNEAIHFNIPVSEQASGHSVLLQPVNLKLRNEPHFEYGRFHRLRVFEMLDHYANMLKLEKQKIPQLGEEAPWSPARKPHK